MLRLSYPSTVIFSSLSPNSVDSLTQQLLEKGMDKSRFRVETKSVRELMKEEGVELGRVCLLDPKAEKVVGPGDNKEFDWFL